MDDEIDEKDEGLDEVETADTLLGSLSSRTVEHMLGRNPEKHAKELRNALHLLSTC